jgi:hypothetical protein
VAGSDRRRDSAGCSPRRPRPDPQRVDSTHRRRVWRNTSPNSSARSFSCSPSG